MPSAAKNTTLEQDFDNLRSRLCNEDFLNCRGLANEVPIYILPYDAAKELEVRRRAAELVEASRNGQLPCNIIAYDLWDVLLKICEEKRILDKIPQLEEKRGSDALLKRLQKIATPEAFAKAMDYSRHAPGKDVLLVTGVGKAYPFVRAHAVLENAQPIFPDIPIVLMYPGRFDGQHLHLFNRLDDGNYYRAFSLI